MVEELTVDGLEKGFGGVRALTGVSFTARGGSVHAVLGENGAGKSTLVRILSGLLSPDAGEVRWGGSPLHRTSVATAFQESGLVTNLSVADNFRLGARRPVLFSTRASAERSARAVLERFGAPSLRVGVPVRGLSVASRQVAEVARARSLATPILILDEANSALSGEQNNWFLQQARDAADAGVVVLLITHRLPEVRAVADRITVLRGGRSVLDTDPAAVSDDDLVEAMVGHRLAERRITSFDGDAGRTLVLRDFTPRDLPAGIDLEVGRGEIVGLAGLDGNGQSEVVRALAGTLGWTGALELDGRAARPTSPRRARKLGIGFVPPDRQAQGLLPDWSIERNITLGELDAFSGLSGWIDPRRERSAALGIAEVMRLPVSRLPDEVSTLSGGNQQRVVLARVLLGAPRLLLLFDGTRGVDVATRESILQVLADQARAGMSILFYSSDLSEYARLAHRVVVMSSGRIVGSVAGSDVTEEAILGLAAGLGRPSHGAAA